MRCCTCDVVASMRSLHRCSHGVVAKMNHCIDGSSCLWQHGVHVPWRLSRRGVEVCVLATLHQCVIAIMASMRSWCGCVDALLRSIRHCSCGIVASMRSWHRGIVASRGPPLSWRRGACSVVALMSRGSNASIRHCTHRAHGVDALVTSWRRRVVALLCSMHCCCIVALMRRGAVALTRHRNHVVDALVTS